MPKFRQHVSQNLMFLNPATRAIAPSTMSTKRMERESGGPAAGTAGLAALKVPMVDCSFVPALRRCCSTALRFGGASRDRTDDLIVANDALSQLSYSPTRENGAGG